LAPDAIHPSPFQPRKSFDDGDLDQLAESIRRAGMMQPVVVRPGASGDYELIAGERRWRAAKKIGLERMPAVVRDLPDEDAAELAIIENVQRKDLSAMERAWGFRTLADRFGLSHAQVAERVGLERSSVTNLVRLTELEQSIQDLLHTGAIGSGHGKALLALEAAPSASESRSRRPMRAGVCAASSNKRRSRAPHGARTDRLLMAMVGGRASILGAQISRSSWPSILERRSRSRQTARARRASL
jgi:ParB family chromosome partitioning protein